MRKKEAHILIIDDETAILTAAKVWLKRFFTDIHTMADPAALHQFLSRQPVDVILLDMNFKKGMDTGREGLYWLKEIKELSPETSVIMMTAYSHVASAVESIKLGAADFVLKPWNNEKLYATVNSAVDAARRHRKIQSLTQLAPAEKHTPLSSRSPAMQQVIQLLDKVAATDANLLILGENGTGKYVAARHVHNSSPRAAEPFVHIDLGSIAPTLFESEMFGYAKGAFTDARNEQMGKLEAAAGGTVFLDEVGNLPPNMQVKLLSVIQTRTITRLGETRPRPINVRFIFATNANLAQMVHDGTFRQDLLYRMNTIQAELPPLRARRHDILALAEQFIHNYSLKYNKPGLTLSVNAQQALHEYPWPGNVRELENVLERAAILGSTTITAAELNLQGAGGEAAGQASLNIEEMEIKYIRRALAITGGNISHAAQQLGLSRTALYRRMEKYNLL